MYCSGGVAVLFGIVGLVSTLMLGGAIALERSDDRLAMATAKDAQRLTNGTAETRDLEHDISPDGSVSTQSANIEISLMLDVSESMAGAKLDALKSAANHFVGRMTSAFQNDMAARIALVPFASSVRLPTSAQELAAGDSPDTKLKTEAEWHWYYGWRHVERTYYKTKCSTGRTGPDAFTDAAPGIGAFVMPVYARESDAVCQSNSIVPLTQDTSTLTSAIDGLRAQGSSAAHVGAAWSWYTLSPNWNRLWASPKNAAAQYGATHTRKFAILLTGGKTGLHYTADGTRSSRANAANGSSVDQMQAICTAMKASGITVYSIGFDMDSGSITANTLAQCATDSAKALSADSGKDLSQALDLIAQDIATRNLSS